MSIELRSRLFAELLKREALINSNKLWKLLHLPVRYLFSWFYRMVIYPFTKKTIRLNALLFTGRSFLMSFPAANDIYLYGCKSHSSELRLVKFLLKYLPESATFVDAGAHYGFFSGLSSVLTGNKGQVFSIEPTRSTFAVLTANTADLTNIQRINRAVFSEHKKLQFFEYPDYNSEYNTLVPAAAIHEKYASESYEVETQVLGDLLSGSMDKTTFIKIDVEGGEYEALKGMGEFLDKANPIIVMEYFPVYETPNYTLCKQFLSEKGYALYAITHDGDLSAITNEEQYFKGFTDTSDNVVFVRPAHLPTRQF